VAGGIALVVVTGLLTIFTIIFGELVPKQIGLAHAERVAMSTSRFIDVLGTIFGPLVGFLTWTTRRISRLFGADVAADERISAEELRLIIEQGGEQGILEAEEEQMINAVIELGSRRVHEVMVPRIAIAAIPASTTFDEAIDTIIEHGHSRIPVYEESVDEILGILYAKDLLPILRESAGPRPDLRALLRTPVYIPESMTVDDLLHEFQRRKVHIAIVLDEYGGTAGLVTVEDIVEELVGEIKDEYDFEAEPIAVEEDGSVLVAGRVNVDRLEQALETSLTEGGEVGSTVGGLVASVFGRIPRAGERMDYRGFTLEVVDAERKRVNSVRFRRKPVEVEA
jgi:CBS domain containing-hemolysin-like protein